VRAVTVSETVTALTKLLAIMVWTLFLAAALRAGAEFIGRYGPGWRTAIAIGGLLSTSVFCAFAFGVFRKYRGSPDNVQSGEAYGAVMPIRRA